jgi:hypothetical protein
LKLVDHWGRLCWWRVIVCISHISHVSFSRISHELSSVFLTFLRVLAWVFRCNAGLQRVF